MAQVEEIIKIRVEDEDLLHSIREWNIAISENKRQQRELEQMRKRQMVDLDTYNQSLIRLKQEEKAYKEQLRQVEKELQANIRTNTQAVGSYNRLQLQLSALSAKYKALNKAERDSAKGKDMVKKIAALQEELKGLDAEMKVYNRNVGNYQSAFDSNKWDDFVGKVQNVSPAAASAMGAVKNFGTALKGLLANPWVLLIMLIVKAFQKMKDIIDGTAEVSEEFSVTLAPLRDFLASITRTVNELVAVFLSLYNVISKVVLLLADLVASGIDSAFGTNLSSWTQGALAQMEESERIARERLEWNYKRRLFITQEAMYDRKIAEAMAKVNDKENYSLEERVGYLREANALERELLQIRAELANENAVLLGYYFRVISGGKDLTAAQKDEIAEAKADAQKAYTQYYTKRREFVEKENSLRAEAAAEAEALRREQEEAEREREQSRLEGIERAYRREQNLAEATIALMEEGHEKRIKQLDLEYQKEWDAINLAYERKELSDEEYIAKTDAATAKYDRAIAQENLKNIRDEYKQELEMREEALKNELLLAELAGKDVEKLKLDQLQRTREALAELEAEWNRAGYESELEYQNALLELDKEIADQRAAIEEAEEAKRKEIAQRNMQTAQDSFGATSEIIGGTMKLVEAMGGEAEKYGTFAKAMAVAQLAIDTAKAIAGAVAQAQSVPFPANIAAIGTGVATVLANVAQAKQLLSGAELPKFHTGGLVEGNGEVNATLLGKESVMAVQTTADFGPLLSELNVASGGNAIKVDGATDFGDSYLYGVFRRALADMPSPVVSVVDINRGQRKVEVIERAARRA